jgi:LysM repeat protein
MLKRRVLPVVLVVVLLMSTLLGALVVQAADSPLYHIVGWGQTLSSIARMYGVTVKAIADANHISNVNLIYSGQRLVIPAAAGTVHVVVKGETLLRIAARYHVSVWEIARRNGLWNINLIFPGQRLVIPGPLPTGSAPAPAPVAPAPAAPAKAKEIVITSPAPNANVKNPVTVTGMGSAFENVLAVDILSDAGNPIGQGQARIKAEVGQYGPFSGTITFTAPISTQVGRIQVYSISPRDGAIDSLTSITVNLQK